MSEHLVPSTAIAPKRACLDCGRNVRVVEIEGAPVALDTEWISVVERRAISSQTVRAPRKVVAYRVHAELCATYQRERDVARLRAEKAEAKTQGVQARERDRQARIAANREKMAAQATARAPREQAAADRVAARKAAKAERIRRELAGGATPGELRSPGR